MTPELPKAIATNIKYFTERTYLLPKILTWLEQSQDRVFLLTGGPGTGKSMVTAWLAGAGPAPTDPLERLQLERIRSQVAAVHFCVAASRNFSPRAASENIANQLTQNIGRFGSALAATLMERVQITVSQQVGAMTGGSLTGVSIGRLDLGSFSDEASFDRCFVQPVKKLYTEGYDSPMLLLFDALDEAQTYTGSANLVQLLSELADLPALVRILATTRSDPRVLKYYTDSPTFDLIADAPGGVPEIQSYAAQRLASEAPSLEAGQRDLLIKRIREEAKGVFLYAQMVLDDLLPRLSDIPDLVNYSLPKGLSRLFHDFLNRELGRDEDRWYGIFQPLLGLISVARWPGLSRTQLCEITGKDIEQPLRACKQYLAGDLPEGPFRIFDRSLTEFFLIDADNLDYHIDAATMHRLITDYYLRTYSQNWSRCDAYGLNHIVEHALASGMMDQERKAAFDRILTDTFVNAIQEHTGWLFAFIEDLEALARVEPDLAAKLCFTLVLDRPPNSLVIQHALRLLAKLWPIVGSSGRPDSQRDKSLEGVIEILGNPAGDIPARLMANLELETDDRVRGAIALALAEVGDPEAAPCLLKMFKNEYGQASWAAADALIALNQRPVIPELTCWYRELQGKNDPRSRARKGRILYVLGWMHAEEAQALKPSARAASDPRIIGRAVDLTWLLRPEQGDECYLIDQLSLILASSPEQPQELGPWADEWLQKRLVRALQKLRVTAALPDLRLLLEHLRSRATPKKPVNGSQIWWELEAAKRERLVEAVGDAITDLQVGR